VSEDYFRGKMPLPPLIDELREWLPTRLSSSQASQEIYHIKIANEKKE